MVQESAIDGVSVRSSRVLVTPRALSDDAGEMAERPSVRPPNQHLSARQSAVDQSPPAARSILETAPALAAPRPLVPPGSSSRRGGAQDRRVQIAGVVVGLAAVLVAVAVMTVDDGSGEVSLDTERAQTNDVLNGSTDDSVLREPFVRDPSVPASPGSGGERRDSAEPTDLSTDRPEDQTPKDLPSVPSVSTTGVSDETAPFPTTPASDSQTVSLKPEPPEAISGPTTVGSEATGALVTSRPVVQVATEPVTSSGSEAVSSVAGTTVSEVLPSPTGAGSTTVGTTLVVGPGPVGPAPRVGPDPSTTAAPATTAAPTTTASPAPSVDPVSTTAAPAPTVGSVSTTTAAPATTSVGSSGRVIWEDNFDRFDASTWRLEHSTYGDGNNELQCYRPENVSVRDGKLVVRAVTETYTCPNGSTRQVTSGMIRSQGVTFSPGQAIEFRVKLTPADPNDQGGLWPAIWASGWAGGWPAGGELDWLEVMTAEDANRAMFSMHYADSGGGHELQNRAASLGSSRFSDSWHTVRFDYGRNGRLVWHLDGRTVFSVSAADTLQGFPAPFDQSIDEIKINMALGGRPGPLSSGAVGSSGATFEVDYIRIVSL